MPDTKNNQVCEKCKKERCSMEKCLGSVCEFCHGSCQVAGEEKRYLVCEVCNTRTVMRLGAMWCNKCHNYPKTVVPNPLPQPAEAEKPSGMHDLDAGEGAYSAKPPVQSEWEKEFRTYDLMKKLNGDDKAVLFATIRLRLASEFQRGVEAGRAEKDGLREAIEKLRDNGDQCESEPKRCVGSWFCSWHQAMNTMWLNALATFDRVRAEQEKV